MAAKGELPSICTRIPPTDSCRLYPGTARQLDARKFRKSDSKKLTLTMKALKINDFPGHLTLLIFNSAKMIIYSAAILVRYLRKPVSFIGGKKECICQRDSQISVE